MMSKVQKSIGDQCKRWRYNHDILQKDVAKACGVTRLTVYRFEEGLSHSTKLLDWYLNHGLELNLKGEEYAKGDR